MLRTKVGGALRTFGKEGATITIGFLFLPVNIIPDIYHLAKNWFETAQIGSNQTTKMDPNPTPEIFSTCRWCNRDFKHKPQYSEHIVSCKFLKERAKERNTVLDLEDDDIPNTRMLYELVKNLAYKCETLESKVKKLQDAARRDKRKIDILQYLNVNQKPLTTYKKWYKSLEAKKEHLDATIDRNIISGVCSLIQDSFLQDPQSIHSLPIAAFSHKHNIFYMYESTNTDETIKGTWTMMTEEAVNSLFDILSNKISKSYNKWEASLPEDSTEESENTRNAYKSKILGLSICEETKYRRFTNWLFNHLKKNVRGITEYEFD